MSAEEFLKRKGWYAGSLMLTKTKGNGLISIAEAMEEYASQSQPQLPTDEDLEKHNKEFMLYQNGDNYEMGLKEGFDFAINFIKNNKS